MQVIRVTYISKFFVSGVNMNFCHRGARNKRVTYISKFFVSGRSLNFNIASGLLSGSFSRIALPETVNKSECVILLPLSHRVGSHLVSVRIHCTEKWRTSFHTDVLSKSK